MPPRVKRRLTQQSTIPEVARKTTVETQAQSPLVARPPHCHRMERGFFTTSNSNRSQIGWGAMQRSGSVGRPAVDLADQRVTFTRCICVRDGCTWPNMRSKEDKLRISIEEYSAALVRKLGPGALDYVLERIGEAAARGDDDAILWFDRVAKALDVLLGAGSEPDSARPNY